MILSTLPERNKAPFIWESKLMHKGFISPDGKIMPVVVRKDWDLLC